MSHGLSSTMRVKLIYNHIVHHARFSGYDPFRSIASSLDRALIRPAGLSLALWAAIEGDLFRFAYDSGFTAALETERGAGEWARFAALNDLYRDLARAVLPFGVAPPGWRAWLTGDGRNGAAARGPVAGVGVVV